MKKRIALLLALALAAGCLAGCGAQPEQEEKPLVAAMELAYPPFETKDENGDPSGISVDFCKAFSEYIGREVQIENISWDGLIPALQTGKADLVMSSMTITEARKETVDFSDPYANALLAILANSGSGVESIDDLNQAGMRVAVKTGSTGYFYAQEHLPNAEIIGLPDESACVTEVAQGKADGFLYDQLTVYRNWQQNPETTKAIFIPFQDVEYWGVAVQKGNDELLGQLNDFIAQYTADGGFDRLSETYLAEEKTAFDELGFKWFFDLG